MSGDEVCRPLRGGLQRASGETTHHCDARRLRRERPRRNGTTNPCAVAMASLGGPGAMWWRPCELPRGGVFIHPARAARICRFDFEAAFFSRSQNLKRLPFFQYLFHMKQIVQTIVYKIDTQGAMCLISESERRKKVCVSCGTVMTLIV